LMNVVRGVALLTLAACSLSLAAEKRAALSERYSHWLDQDVVYIITDEERKEFLKLASDDDRDKFMEDFWESRNPLRGSKQNPYKEEHYKRIEYANETFGRRSNTPGWRTDMGRTYILFGKPTSRRPLPVTGKFILWSFGSIRTIPAIPRCRPFSTSCSSSRGHWRIPLLSSDHRRTDEAGPRESVQLERRRI